MNEIYLGLDEQFVPIINSMFDQLRDNNFHMFLKPFYNININIFYYCPQFVDISFKPHHTTFM